MPTLPVAEYLRMSTEHQQYSLDNQHATIAAYAYKLRLRPREDLHGRGEEWGSPDATEWSATASSGCDDGRGEIQSDSRL